MDTSFSERKTNLCERSPEDADAMGATVEIYMKLV